MTTVVDKATIKDLIDWIQAEKIQAESAANIIKLMMASNAFLYRRLNRIKLRNPMLTAQNVIYGITQFK